MSAFHIDDLWHGSLGQLRRVLERGPLGRFDELDPADGGGFSFGCSVEPGVGHRVRAFEQRADHVEFLRRFVLMSPSQAAVVAIWVIHTYAFDLAESTPYLGISSAEKRSGKTRALELLAELVLRALPAVGISDAALFRVIA